VPEEALTVLAREIVREAGLSHDPEQEAAKERHQAFIEGGREHWKSQVDFFKHMTVISGASIVGVTALRQALAPDPACAWCVSASAGTFLLAALVSLVCLFWASSALVDFSWGTVPAREEAKRALTSSFMLPRVLTYLLFAAGLALLWGGLEYLP
jgi:Ca2+/H+ antiporter